RGPGAIRMALRKRTRNNIMGKKTYAAWKNGTQNKKAVFAVYLILRLLVIVAMVLSLLRQDYESVFVCVLVLVLFLLPSLLQRRLCIYFPSALEIIILVFIFAAEILGELQRYFIHYAHWDTLLHCTSGFLCAALGFTLVDLL